MSQALQTPSILREEATLSSGHFKTIEHDNCEYKQIIGILSLPQELRDQIYKEVIFYSSRRDRINEDMKETRKAAKAERANQCTDLYLPRLNDFFSCEEWAPRALARVSRQIRAEVLELFYRKGKFIFNLRVPQTLNILRTGLTHLRQSQGDRLLEKFWFNWRTLNLADLESFVGIAQIFGTFKIHIPEGAINFGTDHDAGDMRRKLPKTCDLVQDVIDLGRSMDVKHLKDRVSIREETIKMLRKENVDDATHAYRESILKSFEKPGRLLPARE